MRMRKRRQPLRPWLPKKAERGFHGYPIAMIAFYGPTDKLAAKVAVSIIPTENREPDVLERWFSDGGLDVRHDPAIGEQVVGLPQDPRGPLHRRRRRHHRLPPRRRRGLSRRKVLSSVPLLGGA